MRHINLFLTAILCGAFGLALLYEVAVEIRGGQAVGDSDSPPARREQEPVSFWLNILYGLAGAGALLAVAGFCVFLLAR